ncbi:hypothetical protein HDU98_002488, partial [Podochytrium sp. JEL0797]
MDQSLLKLPHIVADITKHVEEGDPAIVQHQHAFHCDMQNPIAFLAKLVVLLQTIVVATSWLAALELVTTHLRYPHPNHHLISESYHLIASAHSNKNIKAISFIPTITKCPKNKIKPFNCFDTKVVIALFSAVFGTLAKAKFCLVLNFTSGRECTLGKLKEVDVEYWLSMVVGGLEACWYCLAGIENHGCILKAELSDWATTVHDSDACHTIGTKSFSQKALLKICDNFGRFGIFLGDALSHVKALRNRLDLTSAAAFFEKQRDFKEEPLLFQVRKHMETEYFRIAQETVSCVYKDFEDKKVAAGPKLPEVAPVREPPRHLAGIFVDGVEIQKQLDNLKSSPEDSDDFMMNSSCVMTKKPYSRYAFPESEDSLKFCIGSVTEAAMGLVRDATNPAKIVSIKVLFCALNSNTDFGAAAGKQAGKIIQLSLHGIFSNNTIFVMTTKGKFMVFTILPDVHKAFCWVWMLHLSRTFEFHQFLGYSTHPDEFDAITYQYAWKQISHVQDVVANHLKASKEMASPSPATPKDCNNKPHTLTLNILVT